MKPDYPIAQAVVDCIAQGREPTLEEMADVAERIWADVDTTRSAFSWGRLPTDSPERLVCLRAAHLALHGTEYALPRQTGDA